jgi:uncharacterized membrane protein
LLNLSLLIGLTFTNYVPLKELALIFLIAESSALCLALMYFLVFKKGVDEETSWKSLGAFTVVLILTLFIATLFPFFAEWLLYYKQNGTSWLTWLGIITTLLLEVRRKTITLSHIQANAKKSPEERIKNKSTADLLNQSKLPDESFIILIGLGLWFIGLGILYGVFS